MYRNAWNPGRAWTPRSATAWRFLLAVAGVLWSGPLRSPVAAQDPSSPPAAPAVPGAPNEASKVAVLFNTRSPRSQEVALFYARSRGIPETQVIGLDCESETLITRQAFLTQILTPLRRVLAERGLAQFDPADATRMTATRLRYLVPVYGMPFRIVNDTNLIEPAAASLPEELRRNGASVDADLMLLASQPPVVWAGPISNPFFAATNAAALRPEAGLFLVSRLDGPTPELAMGLVSQALEAERDGLWGCAYLDLRGVKDGPYKLGDDWLGSAEAVCRLLGFETFVDRNEATLAAGYPMNDIGIYAGWYDANVSGPFTLPRVDFRPGAIAYHLHSFSAFAPRNTDQNWVGPLVAKGATVTMGCVDEPFLQLSPNFGAFLARFASGMNFAEAGAVGQPALSWQTLLIGDPLYRPFSPDLFARARDLEQRGSPLLSWTLLHRVNSFLQSGGNVSRALADLETVPAAGTNAVLAAKVARLYAEKSRLRQAINWGQKSLASGGVPAERSRLFLEVADWQRTLGRPEDSLATLAALVKEAPAHPDLLAIRRRQLELARDLDRADEKAFFQAEVDRLAATAPAGQ
ncbi:MAG: TIGR03790 family protein [Verrucomicrobia bacterium]|nr:TIGR03790 family protein [Verrucomicrobiota bacterium]